MSGNNDEMAPPKKKEDEDKDKRKIKKRKKKKKFAEQKLPTSRPLVPATGVR